METFKATPEAETAAPRQRPASAGWPGIGAVVLLPLLLGLFDAAAAQGEFQMSLPIDCKPGKTCFIQNYMDMDPSGAIKDYRCGEAAYDGHKGTDFRLLSARDAGRGVAVLAAAPGVVQALRDGEPDRFVEAGDRSVSGKECGNGVVIRHDDGWETQYCHMRLGSIAVTRGQRLERGDRVGLVGYSGKTQFAHLHLTVRHRGRVIDPFSGLPAKGACLTTLAQGLWREDVAPSLPYRRGELIELGFTDRPLRPRDFETGRAAETAVSRASPAIVFFARFINLEKGDRIQVVFSGPGGLEAEYTTDPLDRHKAHYVAHAGRKLTARQWPPGRYGGLVRLMRSGAAIFERRTELDLR